MKKAERELAERLKQLSRSRANDAVKLAFLQEENREEIDGLELDALAEFKRSGSGAVEIKLLDRVKILERLAELRNGERGGAAALLKALQGCAEEENGDG